MSPAVRTAHAIRAGLIDGAADGFGGALARHFHETLENRWVGHRSLICRSAERGCRPKPRDVLAFHIKPAQLVEDEDGRQHEERFRAQLISKRLERRGETFMVKALSRAVRDY